MCLLLAGVVVEGPAVLASGDLAKLLQYPLTFALAAVSHTRTHAKRARARPRTRTRAHTKKRARQGRDGRLVQLRARAMDHLCLCS